MGRYALTLIVVLGICTGAQAGLVNQMYQMPVDVAALEVAPDGQWLEGRDWGYANDNFWIMEKWLGAPGSTVSVQHGIEVMGRSLTPITLIKELSNETGFFWTGFELLLMPNTGASISNVTALANAEFAQYDITDLGNGGWLIVWDTDAGGTGVADGDDTTLQIGFEIDGNISFSIEQTPIPEPASLVLMLLGAAVLAKRRG